MPLIHPFTQKVKEIQTYDILLIGFSQTVLSSQEFWGRKRNHLINAFISINHSSSVSADKRNGKKLEISAPSGCKEQIPWGSPFSTGPFPRYSMSSRKWESKKAHRCHKVGISKSFSQVLELHRRTVVYSQHEDWIKRLFPKQKAFRFLKFSKVSQVTST